MWNKVRVEVVGGMFRDKKILRNAELAGVAEDDNQRAVKWRFFLVVGGMDIWICPRSKWTL